MSELRVQIEFSILGSFLVLKQSRYLLNNFAEGEGIGFLARPAFSLLRPRSSNSLEAAEAAEEAEEAEDNDKVLSLMLECSCLSFKPYSQVSSVLISKIF